MNKFEIIADFNNHTEADFAKGLLESYGIKSIIRSDDCGGIAGGQTFIRGVQLIVSRDDLKKAKEILELYLQDFFDLYHHIVPSVVLHSIRSLRELLPIALDAGIVYSIEAHVHSYLESPAMVLELLGEVKGLRHTLDYSHFICLGYRQEEVDALWLRMMCMSTSAKPGRA